MTKFFKKILLLAALVVALSAPVQATTIDHSLSYTNYGEDSSNYFTGTVGAKLPALYLGSSGSEVQLTADIATLNRLGALSSRIVNATGALAVTQALHDTKTITLNAAAGQAITLPAATGSGMKVSFFVGTTITSNSTTITTNGSDVYEGAINLQKGADGTSFQAVSSVNKILTMNGTTKGGILGGIITLEDVGTGVWRVAGSLPASGTLATGFSG